MSTSALKPKAGTTEIPIVTPNEGTYDVEVVRSHLAIWRAVAESHRRRVFVWGAGSGGRQAAELIVERGGAVSGFVQTEPPPAGARMMNLPVVGPFEIATWVAKDKRPFVVVASRFAEAIIQTLAALGWPPADAAVVNLDRVDEPPMPLAAPEPPPPPVAVAADVVEEIEPFGMITPSESRYYEDCAARPFDPNAEIVDLGCWMGATSIALAKGCRRRAAAGHPWRRPVQAYDLFIWGNWMAAIGEPLCDYAAGESFLPEVRRRTREYRDAIDLIAADLTHVRWSGGPIGVLLVDAMKCEAVAASIARAFFPSLRGGSVVIEQDFKHYYTPWIHLLHYRLRDYFRVDVDVPQSATVGFIVEQPIPDAVIERETRFDTVSHEEVSRAFAYSLGLVGPSDRSHIAAAHVMHYAHRRDAERANATWRAYVEAGVLVPSEWPLVQERLTVSASR
jgi:hypothetical protein